MTVVTTMAPKEQALAVSRLSCTVGGRKVLKDCSFEVPAGSVSALIGPNGSGKSTLLKSVAGILPVQDGSIRVFDREPGNYDRCERAQVIGYLPQRLEGVTMCRSREFVNASLPVNWESRMGRAEVQNAVDAAMWSTGATEFADSRLGDLSVGQRQLVLLAAAIACSPRLLLLDEPASFLDPKRAARITNLLRRLAREDGVTIITVEHDLSRAINSADHIVVLDDGEVLYCGAPQQDLNAILRKVFGAECFVRENPIEA